VLLNDATKRIFDPVTLLRGLQLTGSDLAEFDHVLVFLLGQNSRNLPLIAASLRARVLVAVRDVPVGHAPHVHGGDEPRDTQPKAEDAEGQKLQSPPPPTEAMMQPSK
jgi:hypothetical protein